MRISSIDQASHIDFQPRQDIDFINYSVEAQIGDFSARHDSIVLSDVGGFLSRLDGFAQSRTGEVVLEGGEDFWFLIRAIDTVGHLWVGIQIVRFTYLPGPSIGDPLSFSGGFEINTEYANQLFSDLRAMLLPDVKS